MGAKRHVKRKPSGGTARRDRGRQERYQTGGTVSWPTMGDGSGWTAAVTRVRHADDWMDRVGTMHAPELTDGAWSALVEWTEPEPVLVRVPLDNLLPA